MGKKRFIKKVEEPIEAKVGQKQYISFSFELLHDASYSDCTEHSFFIHFLQRLKKLCTLDWNEINKSDRHGFGYEKIPIDQIKKNISIAKDIDYLFSFRATGDNHVFSGFREGNVFKVVFIESKFGDIYNH